MMIFVMLNLLKSPTKHKYMQIIMFGLKYYGLIFLSHESHICMVTILSFGIQYKPFFWSI